MEITFYPGDSIERACAALVAAANAAECRVRGKFNGIEIVVQPNTSTADALVDWYRAEMHRQAEEYRKTPEYAAIQSQLAASARESKAAFAAAMDGAPEMQFRDEAGWNRWVGDCTDAYSQGVVRYATNWARIMQKRIAGGATVAEAATSSRYVSDSEGITGHMHNCATSALAEFWIHGEELKAWWTVTNVC